MEFRFSIHLTEEDYCDFNIFHTTRSYYGTQNIKKLRLRMTAMYVPVIILFPVVLRFRLVSLIWSAVMLVCFAAMQLSLKSRLARMAKKAVKNVKKIGKLPYTSDSVLIFNEKAITEISEYETSEKRYMAIERINLVDNRMIYIYTSSVAAYLLPMAAFESQQQYQAFVAFLETKCGTIEVFQAPFSEYIVDSKDCL